MEDYLPYKSKYSKFDRVILTLAFTLYPVGLLMTLFRVLTTHVHHARKGRNHRLIGWLWVYTYILIMGLFILAFDFNNPEDVQLFWDSAWLYGIILLIPAIVFFILGSRADSKFSLLLQQYYHLVMNRRIREMDHIAVATKQSPSHVIRDLDFMITEHMLPFGRIINGILELEPEGYHEAYDADYDEEYVDEYGDEEYEDDEYDDVEYEDEYDESEDRGREPRSMECPSCGARIIVYANDEKECDYCGNVISA
ncbi:hypothetical protein SAMN04488688_11083 [Paenibacillus sp. cl141a]|uniref:hypothetical protein n=1 Tax=Paenibacillus sp. cl141a TaxID=1761877 RepID=UPI0008D0B008|nr:hypothetical protein [Paenibacillus sp. cl141a]SEM23160.1 hypothetical protein SAMN04488688_11083 [Paenibacillus sp. cl141a]